MPVADVARLLTLRRFGAALSHSCASRSRRLGRVGSPRAASRSHFSRSTRFALVRGDVPALRAHWRDYLAVGIINTALPFALFSFAAQHVAASTAAILNATSPFFATIIAALWLKDRVTPAKIIGMMLGMAGVVLLVGWQPEPMSTDKLSPCLRAWSAALCLRRCQRVSPRRG